MEEKLDRTDIAKALSDISRNTGKISFKVTYTSTDGNTAIDKRFQDFCFNYCNNEYLAGISKLLDYYEAYKDRARIESYLAIVEHRLQLLEDQVNNKNLKEEKEEEEVNDEPVIKTF